MLLKIKTFTITCLLFCGAVFQLGAQPGAGCLECLDAEFEPVCVADADGNVIPFPNACFAECEGFTAADFVECDSIGGPVEPPIGGFPCEECLDAEFEPVCVADADGNVIPFPNACFAECEGFTAADFVACEDNGGGIECDCPQEFEPICVTTDDGDVIPFPNACIAECAGFNPADFIECDSTITCDPPIDFECEECLDAEFEPVCVAGDDGEVIPFPNLCFAECEGFTADDVVECGDLGGGFECQECLDAPFEPVCVTTDDGDVIPFPNACFAECEGFSAEDFVECDSTIFGGNDCVCTEEFDPVCVADADGNVIPFPNACYAECEGFTPDDFVDCGDLGGGFECQECIDAGFEPVCVTGDDGEVIPFPNACFAECAGYTSDDFADCGDINPGEHECMECLDAPFEPVCVNTADGDVIPFPNACFAECEGYTANDFVECDSTVFGPCDPPVDGFECEECLNAEFDLVCIATDDGGIVPFPNLCFAECAGFTADDVVECDGLTNDSTNGLLEPQVADRVLVSKGTSFSLLQNPVTHNLRVGFDVEDSEIKGGTFFILNLNGKVLTQKRVEVIKGSNRYEINVSDLQPGIYMISLETAKGVQTLKFVK